MLFKSGNNPDLPLNILAYFWPSLTFKFGSKIFHFLGLRCFACDNEGNPETCENSPASISNGWAQCEPPEGETPYCYTRRLENEETEWGPPAG